MKNKIISLEEFKIKKQNSKNENLYSHTYAVPTLSKIEILEMEREYMKGYMRLFSKSHSL